MHTALNTSVPLSDGHNIPLLGLGVFQMTDPAECVKAVRHALDRGYRHIDTARGYKNEKEVGAAIRGSSVPREDVFLTSKVFIKPGKPENVRNEVENSLRDLETDYVDLYLLHWPVRVGTEQAWNTLCQLKAEGKLRSVGVSNFTRQRFEKQFLPEVEELPVVNQIECHPFYARSELVDWCREKQILPVAHTLLAQARYLDDPVLSRIAQAHGKTTAQILIRWQIQQGIPAIPKSSHPDRIDANAEVFDVELTETEMTELRNLDRGEELVTWRPEPDWF